jgi:sugar phosphate isomerase/epimerase
MLSRREAILLAIEGSVVASVRGASRRGARVGLQLFSVRKQCQASLPKTLSTIAEIGFEGVELAGYYGHQPAEIRQLLADCGLTCCGAHVPFDFLTEQRRSRTLDFHEALGNSSLVIPGLPSAMTTGADDWVRIARTLTDISQALQRRGMCLGYHNHAVEFCGEPGSRPWDLLFNNTDRSVFVELDLGNAGYAGADPIAALTRYPGRVRMVHVKDYTADKPDVTIGEGNMDWRKFFPVCANIAGTEWFVIEHDSDPAAGLSDIAEQLRRFRQKRDWSDWLKSGIADHS